MEHTYIAWISALSSRCSTFAQYIVALFVPVAFVIPIKGISNRGGRTEIGMFKKTYLTLGVLRSGLATGVKVRGTVTTLSQLIASVVLSHEVSNTW